MDKQSYETIYKGYLFCPTPDCNAQLVFVEGNIQVSHFRTWRRSSTRENDKDEKGRHIDGCPFSINYEVSEKNRRRYDPEYKYNISDEHISAVLRRAYNAFVKKQNGELELDSGKHNLANRVSRAGSYKNEILGTAALFGQGQDLTNGREPRIPVRLLENIDQRDYFQVRCVIGHVSHIHLEENYAYINLKPTGNVKVKIHFNESFIVNNHPQFKLFSYLRDYVELKKENKSEIVCCCVGEVKKTDSGVNVRPDRYSAFSLDNKKLYAIVHEVRKHHQPYL